MQGDRIARVKQSKSDIENRLREQIGFLITSCRLYDHGRHAEAKRLALALRILFHQTRYSKSLLGQLGLLQMLWVDTAGPYDPENLVSYVGLISIRFDEPSGRIPWLVPKGTPSGKLKKRQFNKWWSRPVIVAITGEEKVSFSRRGLVLNVAETDGGAHVIRDSMRSTQSFRGRTALVSRRSRPVRSIQCSSPSCPPFGKLPMRSS